jgi:hypothetical protein
MDEPYDFLRPAGERNLRCAIGILARAWVAQRPQTCDKLCLSREALAAEVIPGKNARHSPDSAQ